MPSALSVIEFRYHIVDFEANAVYDRPQVR